MILLRGGRVLDPTNGLDAVQDVLIRDGIIAALGPSLDPQGARVIDVKGCWVTPGLVDLRSLVRDERDVRAALAGGFTTLLASPESPLAGSPLLTLRRASALTSGLEGEELGELPDNEICVSQGFKPLAKGGVLRRALQYLSPWSPLVMLHAEDPTLTGRGLLGEGETATRLGLLAVPSTAETSVVARDLAIVEETGARVHFSHLTCARSVALVREAKQRGLKVSADVTPHHLTLDDSAAEGFSLAARVWPPLRSKADVQALVAGLKDGTIDAVAADHVRVDVLDREHPFEQCAPGCESFETAFAQVAARVDVRRAVDALTAAPARLLRIEAGHLTKGARADVAVFDAESRATRLTLVGGARRYASGGGAEP